MQYVPAQDHSAALIVWLRRQCLKCDVSMYRECMDGVDRLAGKSFHDDGMRLLTPARADAWLREHVASEPTSLLQGVVL